MPVSKEAVQTRYRRILKIGIDIFTDRVIESLEYVKDPYVHGTVAIRVTFVGDTEPTDYILRGFHFQRSAAYVTDNLEDATFTTWPPRAKEF